MKVKFLNWWDDGSNSYFLKALGERHDAHAVHDDSADIVFISVFGEREKAISYLNNNPNIKCSVFFTGENTEAYAQHLQYDDYLLDHVDLALGFKYENLVNRENYTRFPLWLTYFNIEENQDITHLLDHNFCKFKNTPNSKRKFCALVNSTDRLGYRRNFLKILQAYKDIDVAALGGELASFKNVDGGVTPVNKLQFLRDFKFNICFENSVNSGGYTTEKIFEAIQAGTVPIYWGDKPPEPDLLNENRILFYDPQSDGQELLNIIKSLDQDDELYNSFIKQDIFKNNALKKIKAWHQKVLDKIGAYQN